MKGKMFLLSVIMTASLFAGCGSVEPNGSVTASTETIAEAPAEILPLSAEPETNTADELPESFAFKDGIINVVSRIPLSGYDEKDFIIGNFSDGLLSLSKDGKYGATDKFGNEVVPFIYDSALYYYEGLAEAETNGVSGFIDTEGNTVIPFEYDVRESQFSEGLAFVSKDNDKYGFIDKEGNEIIPFIYEGPGTGLNVSHFSEGLAAVEQIAGFDGNEMHLDGFINTEGETVIEPSFVFTLPFSEGLAYTSSGYINTIGEVVLPLDGYGNLASSFENGYAQVIDEQGEKYGMINKKGELVLPLIYESVGNYNDDSDLILAALNGKDMFIDINGNEIISCGEYKVYWAGFQEGLVSVSKDGMHGYMDTNGDIAVPCIFEYANNFNEEGLAAATYNGELVVLEISKASAADDTDGSASLLAEAGINDVIPFGGYDWRVLEKQEDKVLVITDEIIEFKDYHNKEENITWNACSLRMYLNGTFYRGFNENDRLRIAQVENINPDNPWYDTEGGENTRDHIFLLSLDEVIRYFGDSGDLANEKGWGWNSDTNSFDLNGTGSFALNDQYNANRAAVCAEYLNSEGAYWILRTPGSYGNSISFIDKDGIIHVNGSGAYLSQFGFGTSAGLRPAMWLNF